MRWLITNRNPDGNGFGDDFALLSFWTFDPKNTAAGAIAQRSFWRERSAEQFCDLLGKAAAGFPDPLTTPAREQKHVALFVHGYNEKWTDSVALYDSVASSLFDGAESLGELVSFDWPSKGSALAYLPDRAEARKTGDDLTTALALLYDRMLARQMAAAQGGEPCRARTSVIAHSMGNYALEYALNQLWTRKNRPLLGGLMQQVLMVAADVDNDLFRSGETVTHGDGEGLANLAYRITALYTGRDEVLGASAGLKHFGKRRLGRSGLDRSDPVPDNVWEVDCTNLIAPNIGGLAIHGAYFHQGRVLDLMREILIGTDRTILMGGSLVPPAPPRRQVTAAGSDGAMAR